MALIPSRYGLSVPRDILPELSSDSLAKNCFSKQKFSRSLQEFLVDYSLVTSSALMLTDYPYPSDWKDADHLPDSTKVTPVDNPQEVVQANTAVK